MTLKERLAEMDVDEDVLLADGFDEAFLGIGERCGQPAIAVYSRQKCIEILIQQGASPEEAEEHFDFNVAGGWVGDRTPMFELAHQSQMTQRDLTAEEINGRGSSDGYRGQEAMGWTLTDEQRASGRHGRYRFLVRQPGAVGLSWKAFEDKGKLRAFLRAYGLQLRGKLEPGTHFTVKVPKKPKMRQLVCR